MHCEVYIVWKNSGTDEEKINQEAQAGYQGEILFTCTHRVKVEKIQWKENSAAAWVKEMCLDGEAIKLKTPSQ